MLRARHPTLDLSALGEVIGVARAGGYRAGDQRSSPSGRKLEGVYRESFWQGLEFQGRGNGFTGVVASLVDAVEVSIERVRARFGSDLRWEIYVQHHARRNHGGTLPSALLARMGALSIDLDLEVFPDSQR
jgi:hypothetical protein